MRADEARQRLRNACERNRLGHAFLLVGAPRGSAGETAKWLLKRVMCSAPDASSRPCGTCRVCGQIEKRSWPDIDWVEPEMKSRRIGVNRIRALCARLGRTSLSGGWKAGVLIHADRMGQEGANAFLKTLEEPPPETLLLLLCETPGLLPDTVISRCQRLDIREPGDGMPDGEWRDELLALLAETFDIDSRAGPAALMYAATRMKNILDSLKSEISSRIKSEATTDSEKGVSENDKVLDARVESLYREVLESFMSVLLQWNRDVLILKVGGEADSLFFPSQADVTRRRARNLSLARALAKIEVVGEMHRRLDRNLPEFTVFLDGLDSLHA